MCPFIELFFVTFIIDLVIILFLFENLYIHFLQFITFSLMLQTFAHLSFIFFHSQFLAFITMINSHSLTVNSLAQTIHSAYALTLFYFPIILFLMLISYFKYSFSPFQSYNIDKNAILMLKMFIQMLIDEDLVQFLLIIKRHLIFFMFIAQSFDVNQMKEYFFNLWLLIVVV